MDKYIVFDQILDCVFVVDKSMTVTYANHAATELVGLSQKRLVGKKSLPDLFSLELYSFPFGEDSPGYLSPSSYLETELTSLDGKGRSCKVQMAVTPWGSDESGQPLWVFVLRDVSLEEALHSKYKSELEQKEGYIEELKKAHDHLEDLVEQRTQQLKSANLTLKAIIDSLGQGFLTFNREGLCGDIFTKACESLLEVVPSGKRISDVLKITPEKSKEFELWSNTVFEEMLPFDDMKGLGPDQFSHSSDRFVFLEYFPIRNESEKIEQVVLVATDKTDEVEAKKKLNEEKQFVELVLKFVKSKKQFVEFVKTLPKTLLTIRSIPLVNEEEEKEAFRLLHTLEGEAGTFSLNSIRMGSKIPQQILQSKEGDWKNNFSKAMDDLKQCYESAIGQLEEAFGSFLEEDVDRIEVPRAEILNILDNLKDKPQLSSIYESLSSLVTSETILSNLTHYEGLVKGLAEKLGKKVLPIEFIGATQSIDVRPLKPVFSSMVHIFRNSLDHGIESPEDRSFIGKPEAGKIRIECEMNSSGFKMKISDDGKGISPNAIRRKLAEKFPNKDFSKEDDIEVIQNIFLPGFSSREEVGEFSGRGVGMDAVREELRKLGGRITVHSQEGQGTEFVMEVPIQAWLNVEKAA